MNAEVWMLPLTLFVQEISRFWLSQMFDLVLSESVLPKFLKNCSVNRTSLFKHLDEAASHL